MRETSKCHDFRLGRGDFQNYLRGHGIDIGAGDDPLRILQGTVRPWDVSDGDAQLLTGVPDTSLDFAYSSHCLEHMRDVPEALANWTRVIKPGGFLYIVVPDYVLYEKLTWPSRFNSDHKQSFSDVIERKMVARPNHWNIRLDLIPLLNRSNVEMLAWAVESWRFNYNAGMFDQTVHDATAQICFIAQRRAEPT